MSYTTPSDSTNKTGATRLGVGVLLKFFEQEGRFAASAEEVPRQDVDYVAAQVKVDRIRFGEYRWSGRTIEYHRAQIRNELGFRVHMRTPSRVRRRPPEPWWPTPSGPLRAVAAAMSTADRHRRVVIQPLRQLRT